MKRVTRIFLVLILCLSFMSCGQKNDHNINKNTESEHAISYAIAVYIKTNSEFVLDLDNDGIIQNVQCLDDDAQKVCESLSLQHMPFDVATDLLVEKIKENGLFQQNDIIITISISQEFESDISTWKNNIETAWTNSLTKYGISANFVCNVEMTNENQNVKNTGSSNSHETVEIDDDGNKITTYYDADSNISKVVIQALDGMVENQYFYPSGIILRTETMTPDNAYFEKSYSEQGTLITSIEESSDFKKIQNYHADGWLQKERIELPTEWRETIYQADGILLSEENSNGVKQIYDMAGRKVEAYDIDNYGRRTHIFFLENGIHVVYCHNSDGTVSKTVVTASGEELSHIKNYTGEQTPTP